MNEFPAFIYEDHELYDVLASATDEELGMLVGLMLKKLSCSINGACRDVPTIVNEFQRFDAHTFVTPLRGHGVRYREIVEDVAGKIGVDLRNCQDISEMEWLIVNNLFERVLEGMDDEARRKLVEEVKKLSGVHSFQSVKDLLLNQGVYQSARMVIIQLIVREVLVEFGLQQAAAFAGGRILTLLTGPIGWTLGGLWAAIGIAGPAYSVTVPGVLLVAMVRLRLAAEESARYIGGK